MKKTNCTNDSIFSYTDTVIWSSELRANVIGDIKEVLNDNETIDIVKNISHFDIFVHTDMTVRVYRRTAGEMHGWFHGTYINGHVAWSSGWSPVGILSPQAIASLNGRIRRAMMMESVK